MTLLTTGKNANAGLTFFRHSSIPAFTYKGIYVSTITSLEVRVYLFEKSNSVDMMVYLFPPLAGVDMRVERRGVSLSTVNNVNLRMYPFLPPAVWMQGCIPFHSH
jgi:hypothetical protein